jgi:hypothetical protein
MTFSQVSTLSCFSESCGLCSRCSGVKGAMFVHPFHEKEKPQKSDWEKYQFMLKIIKK